MKKVLIGLFLLLQVNPAHGFQFPRDGGQCTEVPETAMTLGTVITAQTPQGRIKITAHEGQKRKFEWGKNCSQTNTLSRRSMRWYGSCGTYDPAASFFSFLGTCEGVSRIVSEDKLLNFDSVEDAQSFLTFGYEGAHTTYRNDGWAVTHSVELERYQMSVDVVRVLIKGKPPKNLVGAQDARIEVVVRN